MQQLGNSLKTQISDVKEFYVKNDNEASAITPPSVGIIPRELAEISTTSQTQDLYTSLLATVNSTLSASRTRWQQNVL